MTEIYIIDFGGKSEYKSGNGEARKGSAKELLCGKPSLGVVIFDGIGGQTETATALSELFELRHSESFFAAPILTSESLGWADAFFDGVCQSREDLSESVTQLLERADELENAHAGGVDLRILGFVSSRGAGFSVDAVTAPMLPGLRLYPVPIMLGESKFAGSRGFDYREWQQAGADAVRTMEALCARGFVQKAVLKDRYRICARCGSSNINYVDLCPFCGSLNFEKSKMYHCFACGHVAKEADFAREMNLVCPHCNSVLRQIGSDYDIPLESYSCSDCMQRFVEPEVKARCMDCGGLYYPDDLLTKNIYTYTLTQKGAQAVKLGRLEIRIELFEEKNNVIPEFFFSMVDWMLLMRSRYTESDFSIIGLWLSDMSETEYAMGISAVDKMFSEVSDRLKTLLRTTDITMRGDGDIYWILLPCTGAKNAEILKDRLLEQNKLIVAGDENANPLHARCFSIPAEYTGRVPVAEGLIKRFTEEILGGGNV